ncbi:MAG TPA: hypothetical protein VMU28_16100 [Terriglobales bacterium]|nr:hypothetical protein [Terriglobales bacterium]
MKLVTALLLAVMLSASAFAGTDGEPAQSGDAGTAPTARKTAKPKKSSVSDEIDEMKTLLQQQQQQINELKNQLQQRDQVLSQTQQAASQAQSAANAAASKADSANAAASQASEGITAVKGDVTDLKANATATALSIQEDQKKMNEAIESPIAIHYKGITITPGGFVAAETVTRQRAMASDVNTPFNSIPFVASGPGQTTEFFGSGRQSRISILAEGKLANSKLTGYYEMDWLSAGITSNNNQSNSYTNRMRQLWGQVALSNGVSITGGQMWSLATETRVGLDNRTEALPMTIDAQYVVGFTWARQFGFRVTKNFNNKFWLGFSVEDAQATYSATNAGTNFFIGGPGVCGGLYNCGVQSNNAGSVSPSAVYAFNPMPDLIGKVAFQPTRNTHFEVFGIISRFRNRYYPVVTATATNCLQLTGSDICGINSSKTVGGMGVNARAYFDKKKIETAIHAFGGQGVGRYLDAGLPDLTVHPAPISTLAPLHNYGGLAEIDLHPKKWDWYFDGGGEYVARAFYPNATGTTLTGYGVPGTGNNNTGCGIESANAAAGTASTAGFVPTGTGSCTANTRAIFEGTFGFWYKPYNGPKGRIQFGPQYAYIVRNTWRGVGGDPNTNNNIWLTSFRYYLP